MALAMVLTAAQASQFFTGANGLAIPAATYAHMNATKGITTVDDLLEFDKDSVEQLAYSLRHPPSPGAAFVFGAKCQMRMVLPLLRGTL